MRGCGVRSILGVITILCMTIPHKALVNIKRNVSGTVVREHADAKLEYSDIMPFR